MERLYWGILSAGKISHDFVNALNDPSGPALQHNKVVAVAARELDRARTFAENHGIHTVYGSYEELAADGDINVVYVGNTTGQHFDVCKLMLESGKHVLCEKSMTQSASQSKELFDLAKSRKLFLMEAMWSNFFPTFKEIRRQVNNGLLGDVVHLECSMGFDIQKVPRINQRDLGGGAALDLGVYLVNLVRLAFSREEPVEIIARGDLYPSGVDAGWDALIVFKDNRRAVLKCSSRYRLSNNGRIAGTNGYIEIYPPFWCTTKVTLPDNTDFTIELPNQAAYPYNFNNSAGLAYEAEAVSEAIRQGKLECDDYTTEDSLYIARILDEIKRQVGVKDHL